MEVSCKSGAVTGVWFQCCHVSENAGEHLDFAADVGSSAVVLLGHSVEFPLVALQASLIKWQKNQTKTKMEMNRD